MYTQLRLPLAAAALLVAVPALCAELPEGKGKDIVASHCNACHQFYARVGGGYTPHDWDTVLRMMTNQGLELTPDEKKTVKAYLAKNFPEKPKPAAAQIKGPVKVSMKQWTVPTPGSRPHDPLAASDGSLWYTGQLAGVLGRLDPKTGKFKEYKLPTAHSAPHGLIEDREGNIWYTGNAVALVGRLDPKTGKVTEYKMPDAKAHDPHTITIDHDGMLWFTVQGGNRVGRIDPKTGEVKLLTPPTANARPYGMAVSSKNMLFVVEFGANKVLSVDPKTMAMKEYVLPDPKARPRRIAITSDDIVWYTDFSRGYLGRLDPATGKVTEYASPSGPKSEPYGISAIDDVIWYSESGTKPSSVVRFDPKTGKFQTWKIPGKGNGYIVRNTSVTKDGKFVMANSLANEITVLTIAK
jgi:virginiamycin B lyase